MTLTHHSLSKNYQYVLIGKICVLNLQLNIDTLTLNEVFWKWIYSLKWWNTSYPVMVDIPPNNYNTSRYYRCGRPITEQKKCWELLAEKFDRFQTLRNNTQQRPTTCNRVCKRTKHVTSNNVGSCWPTMFRPFARGFKATLAHYAWITNTYGLYSSHDALQVPTSLGVVASVCMKP